MFNEYSGSIYVVKMLRYLIKFKLSIIERETLYKRANLGQSLDNLACGYKFP